MASILSEDKFSNIREYKKIKSPLRFTNIMIIDTQLKIGFILAEYSA